MKREREVRVKRKKSIRVMSMMILMLSSVVCLNGQSIVIDNIDVNADVAGNGDVNNNGRSPFNVEVVGNIIKVLGNSNIGSDVNDREVAGARNDNNSVLEVKDNKVVIDTGGKIWGHVLGGYSGGEGAATSNKVELIRGEV